MSLTDEMDAIVAHLDREGRDPIHAGVEYEDCAVCGRPDPSRCEHHAQRPTDPEIRCVLCGTRIPGPSEWCHRCVKTDPFVQAGEYRP